MQTGLVRTFLFLFWFWIKKNGMARPWRCCNKYKADCLHLVAHQVFRSLQLHRGWTDRIAPSLQKEQQALSGAVNKVALKLQMQHRIKSCSLIVTTSMLRQTGILMHSIHVGGRGRSFGVGKVARAALVCFYHRMAVKLFCSPFL